MRMTLTSLVILGQRTASATNFEGKTAAQTSTDEKSKHKILEVHICKPSLFCFCPENDHVCAKPFEKASRYLTLGG